MAKQNISGKAQPNVTIDKKESGPWLPLKWYYLSALILLFVIASIYYAPSLTGKTMGAHDFQQGISSSRELVEYNNQTGDYAKWSGTMFSGMPAFQVWLSFNNITSWVLDFLYKIPSVYLYVSLLVILSSVLLFYVMGLHPLIVFTGGIGLLLSNFSIVGLMAGHNNKIMVIALVPATLAGLWLLYEKKNYLAGLFVIALSVAFQLRSNHFQITYFMMFLVGMWTVINLIYWIKEKQFKHAILSVLLMILGIGIGALTNATQLWTTQEYSAETQRGGPSPMQQDAAKTTAVVASTGVDYDYATQWCYGKLETFTLLIPNFAGGASGNNVGTNSHLYQTLTSNGVDAVSAEQFTYQVPTYWGPQPFTAGTTYIGAVLIFLMALGFFLVKGKARWILGSTLLITLFIAWGKNFDVFYRLLFDYLPFFNKFRTPSMIFYLSTIIVVSLASLALQALVNAADDREKLWEPYKKIAGGILIFMIFMTAIAPSLMSFQSQVEGENNVDKGFQAQLTQATNNNTAFVGQLYDSLLKDRKSMMQKDALRSTILIALAAVLIGLYLRRKVSSQVMLTGIAVLILGDLWGIDARYINYKSFKEPSETGIGGVPMSAADEFILKDKDPSYRVLDLSENTFNDAKASYYHKSIGGYHSAKLNRYQDIISFGFNESLNKIAQGKPEDAQILNMLNTRYIMQNKEAAGVFRNPAAYGNAWLVDSLKVLKGPVEVFKSLATTNLKNVALLEASDGHDIADIVLERDSTAYIKLDSYSPDNMKYTYRALHKTFAVFSEIYYNSGKGWVAYIDGNQVQHFRVDYVLRGMLLPSGEHKIEFKFEAKSVEEGGKMDLAGSGLIILMGLGVLAQYFIDRKKKIN